MSGTSARLLELLSLLQVRQDWTGPELADRLEVSERTVRKDVDRLRNLGYPVEANRGAIGGYRLGIGATMPPLLLDDDEAAAIVVGLHLAAHGGVAGIADTSIQALAKLESILPTRLRCRVEAFRGFVLQVPPDSAEPEIDPETLTTLANACRNHEALRFAYENFGGTPSRREVEPHRLINWGRKWYLVAWDRDREDWRTFRLDRIARVQPTARLFKERTLPATDMTSWLAGNVSQAAWRYTARVRVAASAEQVLDQINPAVGYVEAIDPETCRLVTGADSLATLAAWIGMLDVDFVIEEPDELRTILRDYAHRYLQAIAE